MELILANPRGFCAGVDRAIVIVERALELFGAPIYVRHEIVHNRYIVENLKAQGAIFVKELDEVPEGAHVIFSAHGVAPEIVQAAKTKDLKIFDATCPLVTKVHMEVVRISRQGGNCILIGHAKHPEVVGTMGYYSNPNGRMVLVESPEEVANLEFPEDVPLQYVTQTTLSIDETQEIITALQQKFPHLKGPKNADLCYATQNRQEAIKDLSGKVDLILVVGSKNSSNSNRLVEVAKKQGVPAYLVDSYTEVNLAWCAGVQKIGISSGASAPELLVQELVSFLKTQFPGTTESALYTVEETMHFTLPKALRIESSTLPT